MRVATWNVNSVRQRETHVAAWLDANKPDLLLLQEIKCEDHLFPGLAFPGYTAHVVGQKSYNGVAILAREAVSVTHRALPGLPAQLDGTPDAQARYIEVDAGGLTVGNLYLPNGNSGGEDGYRYKLLWMDRLAARARDLLASDTPFLLAGDYNVAPADEDFAPGTLPYTDALVRPETRAAWRGLLWQGLTDAVRALHPRDKVYTFWDYQAGAWRRDAGLRIDHALLSPAVAERLAAARPDRDERGQLQPSDHVPLVIDLD